MGHITDEPRSGGLINFWGVVFACLLLTLFLAMLYGLGREAVDIVREQYGHPQKIQCQSCGWVNCDYYDCDLMKGLETIEKNCGGTHIVHKFQGKEWFVFTRICRGEGYCKYDYVPLEKCLS